MIIVYLYIRVQFVYQLTPRSLAGLGLSAQCVTFSAEMVVAQRVNYEGVVVVNCCCLLKYEVNHYQLFDVFGNIFYHFIYTNPASHDYYANFTFVRRN